eukprot:g257.t1
MDQESVAAADSAAAVAAAAPAAVPQEPEQQPQQPEKPEGRAAGGEEDVYERSLRRDTAILTAISVCCMGAFAYLFSGIGQGLWVYDTLRQYSGLSATLVFGAFFIVLVLYLLDFSYWDPATDPRWCRLRTALLFAAFLSFALGSLLSANRYGPAPMVVYLFAVPMITFTLRRTVFARAPTVRFLKASGGALFLSALLLLVVWVVWVASDHWWHEVKPEYAAKVHCVLSASSGAASASTSAGASCAADASTESAASASASDTRYQTCLVAYLVWFAPMMAAMLCGVFGGVVLLLAKTLEVQHRMDAVNGGSGKPPQARGVAVAVQAFVSTVVLAALGLWVASSVAGAGMRMSNAVLPCILLTVMGMGVIICATYGWAEVKEHLMHAAVVRNTVALLQGDAMKGLFVLGAPPAVAIYLALSAVNQFVRVHWRVAKTTAGAEEDRLWVTQVVARQLDAAANWAWSAVLNWAVFWALVYITLNVVVGKIVTLGLAFFNTFVLESGWSLGTTTVVFFGVGLVMFLLPPVPGVPVYLAGGVILTNAAKADFGFGGALVYTIGICFAIKLAAIAVQQKGIGGRMAHNVKVRQAVQINSVMIRSIKVILQRPGLSPAKVAILCGGPDWPTSVLTGILGLSLPQMLCGSAPVVLVLAPTVLAGGFQLEKDKYESLATLTIALAALVQMVAGFASFYFVQRVMRERHDELKNFRDDDPVVAALDDKVAALDAELEQRKEVYKAQTDWLVLPRGTKALLVLAWFAAFVAVYLNSFAPAKVFATFEVTDTKATQPDIYDDWTKILVQCSWQGPLFMACLGVMIACKVAFGRWAGSRVAAAMRKVTPSKAGAAATVAAGHGHKAGFELEG